VLGLAVARHILYRHGGGLSIGCNDDGLTRFVIELPTEESTDNFPGSPAGRRGRKSACTLQTA